MNQKILSGLFIVMLFCLGSVSATNIAIDNYYPAPVEAGDYFTIKLSVKNTEDNANDIYVRFEESYPFSLDPGEQAEKVLESVPGKTTSSVSYKIRTDAGARDGENFIKFQYKDCLGCEFREKSIPVTVMEAQTMFDVVLQELSSEGVFIAIANIGKNQANALTIRIPEQENFKTDLISASIVGNLESGDYTLVGFEILPKAEEVTEDASSELTREQRIKQRQQITDEEKELLIQIDYTDPLGIRRSVFEKIELSPSSLTRVSSSDDSTTSASGFSRTRTKSSFFSGFWFWIVIIGVFYFVIKKLHKKYKKNRK